MQGNGGLDVTEVGQPDPSDSVTTGAGLSMSEASALLGVPAPTLRSWERRYDMPTTPRTEGGHRRYLHSEVVQLRLMRDEVAAGRPAAEAARHVRAILDPENPLSERIADMMRGTAAQDAAAIRAVLDSAHLTLGLPGTIDGVLLPGMRQVGAWWETGRCDVAQEHFATEVVRGWLAKLTTLAPPPTSDRWVLLAVGPRDLHTLGVEALGAVLNERRVGARTLGPRTSPRVLATAAVATEAAAVVVVSHLPTQRRAAVDSIRNVAETGVATYYAGNAFIGAPSRRTVPGSYLGESIEQAADTIVASLHATAGQP
ncbi:B12-binding domain-containing protein [Nocardioides sp.]|uniref:B12-binding domain-containing protein n=1 Tax=Nocardioides sp. TaxID=35761 RepID=UPI002B2711F2|nr:B12-binding domain-containing protein [Nocardioides sp.]